MRTFVVLASLWVLWEMVHGVHTVPRQDIRTTWRETPTSWEDVPPEVHGSFGDAPTALPCSAWTCPQPDDVSGSPGDDGR